MAVSLLPWRRMEASPWTELAALERRMGRMFPWLPGWEGVEGIAAWSPPIDLKEADGEYLLTAELPGMTREDVDLSIDGNVLTLKGEKTAEREEKGEKHHVWERTFGSFERSFSLPSAVDAAAIKADVVDGVLTVHLPKRRDAQGRKIEIGAK